MKQTVCANCKQTAIAKILGTETKVCLICDSLEFIDVDLPEFVTCTYCKKRSKAEDLLKYWTTIPFFDAKTATYYCGCRGWE